MEDDRSNPGKDELLTPTGDDASGDEPAADEGLDRYDEPVLAADATGMLAGEKLITDAEIEEGLDGNDRLAGDV
ncbi:MAG: hypothetical protein JO083_00420 [Candidatus Eremiobacteraeota bacterium]|nr:hypothetical protein [Candidatus Eremiobacteraeota bacterium]MBV8369719.1 hypothetical protein [Candidatus Eremiobacteraeota bacterium]